MEVISSIYNSGYNIKKFYLGSRELNLAYLGNQVIYDEVIGDNDLNYILYEFYGSDTLPNTVEAPVKSAILKGSTKYRDIDTGEFLETFEEGRNLELVSVKMPVLTTNGKNMMPINSFTPIKYSGAVINHKVCDLKLKPNTKYTFSNKFVTNGPLNMVKLVIFDCNNTQMVTLIGNNYITFTTNTNEDYWVCIYNHDAANKIIEDIMLKEGTEYIEYEPYKSNILTVNEDVTLRSNGDVYDELNLLTGRLTQRIDENNEVLAQEVVKTVDLTIVDQDGKTINKLNSFNGTTHVSTDVAENSAYPMVSLEVASELQAAMSKVTEDIELIKPVQNDIETTIDTQSNDIDSLLLATTELFEMIL